jgi:hypothetical protein
VGGPRAAERCPLSQTASASRQANRDFAFIEIDHLKTRAAFRPPLLLSRRLLVERRIRQLAGPSL